MRIVDLRDNDAAGQTVAEAIYVDHLEIDVGASFLTGPYTVYYRTMTNLGLVDHPSHLVPLGPLPGDCDENGSINSLDAAGLIACLAGPGMTPPASGGGCDCLETFDFDTDDDIDLLDFAVFQTLMAE